MHVYLHLTQLLKWLEKGKTPTTLNHFHQNEKEKKTPLTLTPNTTG